MALIYDFKFWQLLEKNTSKILRSIDIGKDFNIPGNNTQNCRTELYEIEKLQHSGGDNEQRGEGQITQEMLAAVHLWEVSI